jgi:Major Facilitator Superfamily
MAHARVPPRIRRVQASALALLVIAGTLNYVDRAALSIANPLIREELGLSIADMGLLLSAFLWAYAFSQLPGGALTDRVGPRRLLGLGLFVCTGGGWSGRELLAVRYRPRLPWCRRGADVFRRSACRARLVERARPRIAHRDLELRLFARPYHRAAAADGPDDLLRLALDVRLHGSSRDRRRYRVVYRLSRSGGGGAFPGRGTPPHRRRGGAAAGTARDTG